MKSTATLAAVIAVATFAAVCPGCGGPVPEVPDAGSMVVSSHEVAAIEWSADWDGAFAQARSQDKAVLVTFYADWCIWCKRFEDTTLADQQVASYLKKTVVPVRLNVDGDGEELSNVYKVDGLPTILLLDSEGRELGRIPGYLPPGGFLERVRGILS